MHLSGREENLLRFIFVCKILKMRPLNFVYISLFFFFLPEGVISIAVACQRGAPNAQKLHSKRADYAIGHNSKTGRQLRCVRYTLLICLSERATDDVGFALISYTPSTWLLARLFADAEMHAIRG